MKLRIRHFTMLLPFIAILLSIRKASQLDSRIAKTNPLLVKCYYAVGKWEKAVSTYQSMDYVYAEGVGHEFRYFPNKLDVAKDHIHRERQGFHF
ncbi:hypothetical protein JT359_19825 [Candidatus Poribacteria bacterium]|nr:hypothetical protein [Candidatus Poribacteria bacterium]